MRKFGFYFLGLIILSFLSAEQIIDFSDWNGNFTVTGENAYDAFASSLASGDVNGDGLDDIIAGANSADPNGRNSAGCLYIFFGNNNLPQQTELSAENADVIFWGAESGDQLGKTVAVGNFNNDQYDDIIVSAPFADYNGREAAGKVYVIFGKSNFSTSYDLLQTTSYDSAIYGEAANDFLGQSLDTGDINGDNFDDIIIGTPKADEVIANCGKTYIIFGNNNLNGAYDLNIPQSADLTIIGEAMNDNAGTSLKTWNCNADIYDDIIIGAPNADPQNRPNAGIIYLIKGKAVFSSATINLADSPEVTSRIWGDVTEANIGATLTGGDVNGDNKDDILFSDFAADGGYGSVEILFGSNTLPQTIDLASASANIHIENGNLGGVLGEKIYAGNINNDNYDDIIIAAPQANTQNGNDAGVVYLLYGKLNFPSTIDLDTEVPDKIYFGASANDRLGNSLTLLSFNDDEKKEICLGAEEGGNNKGIFYTVFGDLPYVWDRVPDAEESEIDIDAYVTFKLTDEIDGIDLSSVAVIIGGTEYTVGDDGFVHSGGNVSENEYSITIIPVTQFGYNQSVDVTVDCRDMAGWQMPEESYRFYTREDTDAPYTDSWNPAPNEENVPIDKNISFHVYDNGEGVDINSVVVGIQGTNYYNGNSYFDYSGDPNDYQITIDPPLDFDYGENVSVSIDASDRAEIPNVMATFQYNFLCAADTIPPLVINWSPELQEEIPVNAALQVEVVDYETGVDINSIQLYLDDEILTIDNPVPNGDGNGFIVGYTPSAMNYYSLGEHEFRIVATDNAIPIPNEVDSTSTFICIEDGEPPFTQNHFPNKYETDAATNTIFLVEIIDTLMGVDVNTISITLNGEQIIGSPNTNITQIGNGYRIRYTSPERLLGQINVIIDAADMKNPPNVMPTETYYFICTLDNASPYVSNLEPQNGDENVPIDTNIQLEVHDDKTGVDPSSIELSVNGVDVTSSSTIQTISGGYFINYFPETDFDFNETVNISVQCQDLAITPNQLNYSYSFVIQNDIEPPYVINQNPPPDTIGVPLNTNIYLEIVDDGLGVDETSIIMYVENELVHPDIESLSEGNGFALNYNPPNDFEYSQEVEVTVFAGDNAEPPNSLSNYSYSFTCMDDDQTPPFIRGENPSPNAQNVPVNTVVSFEILDGETGVDRNSVNFRVNGITIDLIDNENIEEVSYHDTSGYYIYYQPQNPFEYGQQIQINIFAMDLSSNFNQVTENYSFTCEPDLDAPEVVSLTPQPDSSGFPLPIYLFHFRDEKSGIDSVSFNFKIDNIETEPDSMWFENKDFFAQYQPPESYQINENVNIYFYVADNIGNFVDSTYTFTPRNFPPEIVDIFPRPDSSGYSNSVIYYHFRDSLSVIDTTSFTLKINNSQVSSEFWQQNYEENDLEITYNPNGTLMNGNNNINFSLRDYLGNSIDSTYSFRIIPDEFPPYLNAVYPQPNSNDFDISQPIVIDILDRGMGIADSTLEFFVFSERIHPTNYTLEKNPYGLNPDSLGFRLIYTLAEGNYYSGQQIVLRFTAADLQFPPNIIDSTLTFFIERPISEQVTVEAVPSTLTLNGDGYNDECKLFIYSDAEVSQIIGKIYNRRGRMIKLLKISEQDSKTKFAVWDGSDKENRFVSGGLYIYQIKVKNKVYQGSIVVAK